MKEIAKKLFKVQQVLNAPKDQFNSFGKYSYRSCEGILEALKPHLCEYGMVVTLSDEVVDIGGRVYVKATATAIDTETDSEYSVTAFAREEESKKGMDASQVTGAASSYARKYALNGLFAIDDNKDSDATNNGEKMPDKSTDKKAGNYTPKPDSVAAAQEKSGVYAKADELIKHEGNTSYSLCSRCGGYIYDQRRKDGSVMSVRDYVATCIQLYGEPVCRDCMKNAR